MDFGTTEHTPVRTEHDALVLVRERLVVTEVPSPGVASLVGEVAGGPVAGSWREHAKGRLMYRLGRVLRASDEVLALRLVEGKVAFVDRSLWAAVYRVVMDPSRRRAALAGLSPESRALLEQVERERRVLLPKVGAGTKAREVLEERLLAQASETQREDGRHVAVLRAWRDWASPTLQEAAMTLSYEDARERLRRACGGAPAGLGPWIP
ncbi:RNA methyltransferase [Myxococcaceae bacterium GXIMD 01537]